MAKKDFSPSTHDCGKWYWDRQIELTIDGKKRREYVAYCPDCHVYVDIRHGKVKAFKSEEGLVRYLTKVK